jgi:ferritin-like protein
VTGEVVAQTRRELVRRAALSAAAVAALSRPAPASAETGPPESNTELLQRTLRTEQLVVVAYRQALGSGALSASVARLVKEILGQELTHVAALDRELRRLGAEPAAPPRDLVSAQRGFAARNMHMSLTDVRSQRACLKLLINVETVAETAYLLLISKLDDPRLLRLSAELMGSEAQHWTVLSSVRHHGDVKMSVPYPFVGGSIQ